MNEKTINFEAELFKSKLKAYEEDLKTNYIIVKRKENDGSVTDALLGMDQYDLFNLHTQEPYVDFSIFSALGIGSVTYPNTDIICALAIDSNKPITQYETITVKEVEQMINYIQFAENVVYSNTFDFMDDLSLIEESPYYEEYQRVLLTTQYCFSAVAKLHF